ncbi:MAG: hypothetical protein KC657_08315 [Myxococcales bacterium]|nr:hypothetical protein [Myxococcales bacterium]
MITRTLLRHGAALLVLGTLGTVSSSCSDGFGALRGGPRLLVEILPPSNSGTRTQPLTLEVDKPLPFTIKVTALTADGQIDTAFDGFVRISAKPGALAPIGPAGRNIKLNAGTSDVTVVQLTNAYGITNIVADDIGHQPVDPFRDPPPACADGLDNDGDGLVDFPADPGCAFPNDDSETGGRYAQGASPPIYFKLPRIGEVRGVQCNPPGSTACFGSGNTPYPKEQLNVDTGWREDTRTFEFSTVVTRISSNGFYVTDLGDPRGFNSLFVFNFNAPARMRVCDRLKTFGGTASEFFGFTQLSYPTWTLEEYDQTARECLVPEPRVLSPAELQDQGFLLKLSGGLVRLVTGPAGPEPNAPRFITRVTKFLGPKDIPLETVAGVPTYVPKDDASNCDFNKDGKIDFTAGSPEGACSDACTGNPECSEYSNFISRSNFRLVTVDGNNNVGNIQADASTSPTFDAIALRGKEVRAFSGTLHYFSGGAQYTIEARCTDDVVVDVAAQPLPSNKACVFPRTILENNPQ